MISVVIVLTCHSTKTCINIFGIGFSGSVYLCRKMANIFTTEKKIEKIKAEIYPVMQIFTNIAF